MVERVILLHSIMFRVFHHKASQKVWSAVQCCTKTYEMAKEMETSEQHASELQALTKPAGTEVMQIVLQFIVVSRSMHTLEEEKGLVHCHRASRAGFYLG